VHEAYLRLVGSDAAYPWKSRGHFFAAAAEAMRRILVEHARAKQTMKRGGGRQRVELDLAVPAVLQCDDLEELLELDAALARLEQEDSAKAELVKLLYFAGFTLDEAAAAQGLTRSTAYRHWLYARAWLRDAIAGRAKSR
jgi:RNA polymerase sigma factor (TIGR02999 family)